MGKKVLLLALIASLMIGSTNSARAEQTQKESESPRQHGSEQITPEEIKQARDLADRFIKRLRETRDLTPLVSEMFASSFKRTIVEDDSWGGIVGQGRSLVEHISSEQRLRCFIVGFNLQYLLRLYIAGNAPLDSKEASVGDKLPPTLVRFMKENLPPEDSVETTEGAQVMMSFLERAVALMQEEIAKNPPEQTEQFKANLAAFEAHLNEHAEERPSVRVIDENRNGLVAGTRLIRMVIPFHVGLIMVQEKDGLKLDLVATHMPPP
jgi:hypothetical protein